jgi:hypothetical protein
MPPFIWGLGSVILGAELPKAGLGRSCPIMPRANFAIVFMVQLSSFLAQRESGWPKGCVSEMQICAASGRWFHSGAVCNAPEACVQAT